ncbi:MAG: transcriptional regulator BetI [Silicimonas sp.]|nr:transcriptional regulator BetI [Silicimonas sp.]
MPKLGMEPLRRASLIHATIAEIGAAGSLDVTVARIAKRAGMSSALAHHYFGGKDDIFLAAMRQVLRDYRREVLSRLKKAQSPEDRVRAIVEGGFAPSNFRADTVCAWLNFYVLALSSDPARRLHRVYARRLRSNLTHAFRPFVGEQAQKLANRAAELIDGVYLNQGLAAADPDGIRAAESVLGVIWREIEGA